MAHAFYMDVHVPMAVTAGLRLRGVDVLTSQQDRTQAADDESLLARATALHRIMFTQDDDFLEIASRWQQQDREFVGLVYCHQLACGIGETVDDLELLAACASVDEVRSQVIFLPLR